MFMSIIRTLTTTHQKVCNLASPDREGMVSDRRVKESINWHKISNLLRGIKVSPNDSCAENNLKAFPVYTKIFFLRNFGE